MPSPTRRSLLLLPALALALAACSSTVVQVQQPAADLGAYRTFAWSPPPGVEGARVEGRVVAELQTAVERELAERGLGMVTKPEADLFVRADLFVEVRTSSRHAYTTGFYTADRFEDGVVAVRLIDARSKEVVWEASGKRKLRHEAEGYGMYEVQWTPTGDEREWSIDEVVGKVLSSLPSVD